MRKISKSKEVPARLAAAEVPESFEAIDSELFSAADVKETLRRDQHGKCAYCECLLNGDYGHTEHYRPKGGYVPEGGTAIHRPGYYWLAYDWNNLLLSCSRCNVGWKRSHFALADESARDIAGHDISRETPLLLNPAAEDPADSIMFRRYMAVPRHPGTLSARRAQYTIATLGLNSRADLVEARRKVWASAETFREQLRLAGRLADFPEAREIARLAREQLVALEEPDAPYSAMNLQADDSSDEENSTAR